MSVEEVYSLGNALLNKIKYNIDTIVKYSNIIIECIVSNENNLINVYEDIHNSYKIIKNSKIESEKYFHELDNLMLEITEKLSIYPNFQYINNIREIINMFFIESQTYYITIQNIKILYEYIEIINNILEYSNLLIKHIDNNENKTIITLYEKIDNNIIRFNEIISNYLLAIENFDTNNLNILVVNIINQFVTNIKNLINTDNDIIM